MREEKRLRLYGGGVFYMSIDGVGDGLHQRARRREDRRIGDETKTGSFFVKHVEKFFQKTYNESGEPLG